MSGFFPITLYFTIYLKERKKPCFLFRLFALMEISILPHFIVISVKQVEKSKKNKNIDVRQLTAIYCSKTRLLITFNFLDYLTKFFFLGMK